MAKPYSQDLRDRVIDAVKRGEMSRRAAARHDQKKTLVAREQDRPDISRHRKRWRTYQGLIDPRRLVFKSRTL